MADILPTKNFLESFCFVEGGFLCRLRMEPFETKVVLPVASPIQCDPIWMEYEDPRGITRMRLENVRRIGLKSIDDPVTITAIREDFVDRRLILRGGLEQYQAALEQGEEFCLVRLTEKGE